jgi:DNA-directed RNA polymerase beta' subunit
MSLQLLDIEKFLRQQQAKSVTNTRQFTTNMEPAPGGLQDPSIFGVSVNDRFKNYGVINLENVIMHPLVYDNLNVINPVFKRILQKKKNYELVDGMLKETTSGGGTGLDWLMSKWDKINFDKYRTEKNKLWIDFIQNSAKNILFINKIPVIPINYREAHMGNFKMELDALDELYQKIMEISKSGRSDFTSEWMQAVKDKTGKDLLQNRVNNLFNYFISKIEGKSGFIRNSLVGKRLDNVARMVANARPDIPINSAVLPWHILLNIFDIYVVSFLNNDTGNYLERLGLDKTEKTVDEYGELFDYIYRNSETYEKHYPGKKEIWIEILVDIFNANPMLRILLKRDPGWNADSIWCLQPLINTENSYQIWVPSWLYSPLGGDSLNTDFFIASKTNNTIYEDRDYLITGDIKNARVIKTMDSVWRNL